MNSPILSITLVVVLLASCKKDNDSKLFAIRHGDEVGIDFQNTITTNDSIDALSFEYIYNGSGVGVGDFNNDGLSDLFFGGNQVSSRLYLNQGKLQFKDITKESGVTTDRWVTGVSVVDINHDGWLDVHLAVAGYTTREKMKDFLFINQGLKNGIPVFKEMAHQYGLDDDGYGTLGAFFDYDKDGDLDMYLLTNSLESFNRNNLRPKRTDGTASSTDRLYRNNGDNTFTNVSHEAGIVIEGYGLGINICDLNQDSWPDIYVSNDFMSNDLIWINQGDGTFKNKAGDYLKHQTHNGMGNDVADFNNDGLADIVVVDMLPPGQERQKMMTPGQNYDNFHMSIGLGYQPQYMRNTLQLNRGIAADGNVLFSEIAFQGGVSRTDWSWAPLFADFDNDGWKDLFIANGYRKEVTNLDFIFFGIQSNSPFGTQEVRKKKFGKELEALQDVKLSNYIFRNTGSLTFEDKTKDWGIDLPTFSNGAAFADFDNDGDLDIVTNNIDQEVILYENRPASLQNQNHFIRLQSKEIADFNQKISIYINGKSQFQELTPYRGFQSSVAAYAHFGVGKATVVDSIIVEWNDHMAIKYFNIKVDTVLTFSKEHAVPYQQKKKSNTAITFQKFEPIIYKHKDTSLPDIKNTRTLLHELSRFGPCLATGDVNGDGIDDFFIGGEKGIPSNLFIQQANGKFISKTLPLDSMHEDGAALFFDADTDGDLDLYVGGACASSIEQASHHHLFSNDGKGNFTITQALPEINTSSSCIEAADYDGDGDLDLFVGGRIIVKEYPFSPRSYVLRNDNGKFIDVTEQLNESLKNPGMVSSAVWADIDNDKRPDLVLAGEWMPIRVFKNLKDKFIEITKEVGLENSNGWWNCLKAADLNEDGFIDIIAGNTGKNSFFQPTLEHPVQIVAKDFDKNGFIDPVITYYNPVEKDRFMIHNRMVIIDQIPSIKKRFERFSEYAKTPFEDAFTKDDLQGAYVGNAYSLASELLMNKGGKSFERHELPEITQLSTLNDLLIEDVNGDQHQDLVLVGNNYAQETLFGRYDASVGTILLGDGKLNWKNVTPSESKFIADGDAKFIKLINVSSGKACMVTNNNDSIDFFYIFSSTIKTNN